MITSAKIFATAISNGSPVCFLTAAASSNTVQLSSGNSVAISKDLIKIVQDVLNQKGYDCGTPDGIAGSKTKAALQKFISENTSDDTDNKIVKMIAEGLGIK